MVHPSVIIAAPSSGSGKTTVTLGLIRAFCDRGVYVSSAKIGPDYIDPRFHEIASNRRCINLDSWSMREHLFEKLVFIIIIIPIAPRIPPHQPSRRHRRRGVMSLRGYLFILLLLLLL